MDIDMVYLWVNGNDPKWKEKRDAFIGRPTEADVNCVGRYADNDELKYSLRSVQKYAPWIHRIFIVTDDQVPCWLDTDNEKIQIVDHREIMPAQCLPCFNACVIEHHLHNVPGLAEHFIFANDDMYINRPVSPGDFFAADGLPKIRFNRRPARKMWLWIKTKVLGRKLNTYAIAIHNGALLVERKYGIFYNSHTHHNMDAYLKSTYAHAREVFDTEISPTLCNHMRSPQDIQRNLYSYVALAEKRGHLCYVGQHTSFRFHIDNHSHYKKFLRYNPMLFCMNDSQYATDDDRRASTAFLQRLFPDKSAFEK